MTPKPHMTVLIKGWLAASRVFSFGVRAWAKRMHVQQGANPARFAERLGQSSIPRPTGRLIWIHAASLGEVAQTGELVAKLQENEKVSVLLTTATHSGAQWVAHSLPGVLHQYLPLDTPDAVNGFLDHWAPDIGGFVEADIWPRLVIEAARREIPLALLNARPSRSRERAPKSYRFLLSKFFALTCKSAQVLEGFRALDVPSERLHQLGDLRASVPALAVDSLALADLQDASSDRPVWIAASSHADDEAEILIACRSVQKQHPEALLIWAPRHPQRAVNILQAASGLVVQQRTKPGPISNDTQIYLADTLGEMGTLFSYCNIVFLGGSFGSQGGHNPFEPAHFGCFILTGPNIENHRDAFAGLAQVGAVVTVQDGAELGVQVAQALATDEAGAKGAQAQALMADAGHAAEKTVSLLMTRLS